MKQRDIVYTGDTLKTSSLAMSRMPMKNNQRERHRERANARTTGKGKGKDDGFTTEQRRERDAKELQEKTAKNAAQAAAG
ncbi:hypothetical protein MIMGU_mgv1a024710mg, partial [Erythranthe guttata]